MRKLFSLDFLDKKVFDKDIVSADGEIICKNGDTVTPEIVLKLYFQDIYEAKEVITLPEGVEETSRLAQMLQDGILTENYSLNGEPFDKEHAKRVVEYSVKLGNLLELDNSRARELEVAAYFHDIGKSLVAKEDMQDEDFETTCADAAYEYMLKERQAGTSIAEAIREHGKKYDCLNFPIQSREPWLFPLSGIIAIATYFDEFMLSSKNKETAILKLLRLGGNRFNIYMLHKFINMMREREI